MKLIQVLPVLLFVNFCLSYQDNDGLLLRINDGEILGRYMTSETRRTVSGFIGIPFASPPVGDLRFRAPQKPVPWNETLLTQNQLAKCPQIDTLSGSNVVEGDEDCLYVNVYVPETNAHTRLDVLVWIHGGGFTFSHGGPSFYGPDYLLEHDVILVAGNYRLGALGFLSTEDRNSPGNFGLKDQAFMLQWVQYNIEHFGGNKDSVTIWGESAGGVSVHFHMISPISSGLFHRAISNSGRQAEPVRSGVGKAQAVRLAVLLNCTTVDEDHEDTEEIIRCLRLLSLAVIIYVGVSFPIVLESFESDEDAFIENRNFAELFFKFSRNPLVVGNKQRRGTTL